MHIRLPSPALVISCIALLLAAGGTSFAAITATGNAVNITDPVTAANKAKVDATGKLQVTVNGTAGARPVAPTTPWSKSVTAFAGGPFTLAGPKSSPINLTSISISLPNYAATTDKAQVLVMAYHVPSSATTCASPTLDGLLWDIPRLTASAPFAASFPTPLQVVPPAGTKACLLITVVGTVDVTINASGFVS